MMILAFPVAVYTEYALLHQNWPEALCRETCIAKGDYLTFMLLSASTEVLEFLQILTNAGKEWHDLSPSIKGEQTVEDIDNEIHHIQREKQISNSDSH